VDRHTDQYRDRCLHADVERWGRRDDPIAALHIAVSSPAARGGPWTTSTIESGRRWPACPPSTTTATGFSRRGPHWATPMRLHGVDVSRKPFGRSRSLAAWPRRRA